MKQKLPKMIKTLFSDMRQAIIGIILAALILSVGGIYLFAKNVWLWMLTTMQLSTPLWATILLVLLSGLYTYLKFGQTRSSRPTSEKFTEHHGAFFKRKPGGGYHEAVYCGICKSPTSTGSHHMASYYKCKCGWVSSFNQGDFSYIFKELMP